ncbi:MAG: glycosyltransferase family 39 protein [Planctomycetota bacterium]|nr:glycosyltransferase family 39 protein [Planctomycetota bacterium]
MSLTDPRLREALLVALLAGLIFLYGLDRRALLRASEGRVARVAQEMLDDGEWVVPHLNGEARVKKPPLASWVVALWARAFNGGLVTVREACIPSGLAGALCVLLAYLWCSRKPAASASDGGDRAAGWLAALALTGSAAFYGQARMAEIDIWVALFTLLAFRAWEDVRGKGCPGALLLFYTALALGVLAKGHVILVLVAPVLGVWGWLERRGGAPAAAMPRKALWHLAGLALFLAPVLGWGIPFLQRSGMTFSDFYQEGVNRFGEDTGHQKPAYYYVLNVLGWALPWSVWLPFVAWWQRAKAPEPADARRRLWWLWFGVNLALWSCLSAKQRHYAVPWLVPLALLAGDGMAGILREFAAGSRRVDVLWGRRAALWLGVLLAAAGPALAGYAAREFQAGAWVWIFGGLSGAAFLLGTWKLLRGSCACHWAWWGGVVCLTSLFALSVQAYEHEAETMEPFCARAREALPEDAALYDAGIGRPQMLFYLRRNVRDVENRPEAIAELLRPGGSGAYVLVSTKTLRALPSGSYREAVLGEEPGARFRYGAHLLAPAR